MEPRTAAPASAEVGDVLIYQSRINVGIFVVRKVTFHELIGIVELQKEDITDVHFDRKNGTQLNGEGFVRAAKSGEIQQILDENLKNCEE